jgi:hypothetical protein
MAKDWIEKKRSQISGANSPADSAAEQKKRNKKYVLSRKAGCAELVSACVHGFGITSLPV